MGCRRFPPQPRSLSPPVPCVCPAAGGEQGARYSDLCPKKGVFIHPSRGSLLPCAEPRSAGQSPESLGWSRMRKALTGHGAEGGGRAGPFVSPRTSPAAGCPTPGCVRSTGVGQRTETEATATGQWGPPDGLRGSCGAVSGGAGPVAGRGPAVGPRAGEGRGGCRVRVEEAATERGSHRGQRCTEAPRPPRAGPAPLPGCGRLP